jgi:hypothetical protein
MSQLNGQALSYHSEPRVRGPWTLIVSLVHLVMHSVLRACLCYCQCQLQSLYKKFLEHSWHVSAWLTQVSSTN